MRKNNFFVNTCIFFPAGNTIKKVWSVLMLIFALVRKYFFFLEFRTLTPYRIIDWLIIHCFTSRIWRCHHYRWRDAKFRPMFGAQGLWAGRDL
jgi:hypothetical protein